MAQTDDENFAVSRFRDLVIAYFGRGVSPAGSRDSFLTAIGLRKSLSSAMLRRAGRQRAHAGNACKSGSS